MHTITVVIIAFFNKSTIYLINSASLHTFVYPQKSWANLSIETLFRKIMKNRDTNENKKKLCGCASSTIPELLKYMHTCIPMYSLYCTQTLRLNLTTPWSKTQNTYAPNLLYIPFFFRVPHLHIIQICCRVQKFV